MAEDLGTEETRPSTGGTGEEQPIVSDATRDGRIANRRIAALLLD